MSPFWILFELRVIEVVVTTEDKTYSRAQGRVPIEQRGQKTRAFIEARVLKYMQE